MTEVGISSSSGFYWKICRDCLTTRTVLCVIYVFLSIGICSASPVSSYQGWDEGGYPKHVSVHRRSIQNLEVAAPREKCFQTKCNRVTHYCDEVIRSCASCEDDCHPGRIDGDEQTTKECHRKCDWYYYVKAMESSLLSASETTEADAGLTDHVGAVLTDYQLFSIILTVVVVCFTVIIAIMAGMFYYFFKKLSSRPVVVGQETKQSSPIYNRRNSQLLRSSIGLNRKNNGDTDLKLLASSEENSLNNRTEQQEGFQNSFGTPSSVSLISASQRQNHNRPYSAQIHTKSTPSQISRTDSSTQQLVS